MENQKDIVCLASRIYKREEKLEIERNQSIRSKTKQINN